MSNGINTGIFSAIMAKNKDMPSTIVQNTALRDLIGGGIAPAIVDSKTFDEVKEIIDERDRLRRERNELGAELETAREQLAVLREKAELYVNGLKLTGIVHHDFDPEADDED